MRSCLTHLEGSSSGETYPADRLQRLDPVDGRPLLARYDTLEAARSLTPWSLATRKDQGMWRWWELLPLQDARNLVHLGEGGTPLLDAPRLGGALGVEGLLVKAEGLNPTGSFKSRGMSAAVSMALELGATALIAPSAGNAGGALAAYGAAAGLPVTVVMPADTPEANVVEAQVCGAEVILVEGFISDCGRVSAALGELTGAFDVSTLKEPYRVEGKKTMGLELVEQLSWGVPDVIVYPTGGGTGLVGMWKAFDELEAMGLIGAVRPRMVSVQAAGCAPIVRAFEDGATEAIPWESPSTRASGLRVPGAVGDRLILSALRESDGTAVAVPEGDIDRLQVLAGRRGVGYVSPETAAAFAAVATLADEGWLRPRERVVVFDTGIGQKYPPPPLPRPVEVRPDIVEDPEALRRLAGGRRRRPSQRALHAVPTMQTAAPPPPPSPPPPPPPPELVAETTMPVLVQHPQVAAGVQAATVGAPSAFAPAARPDPAPSARRARPTVRLVGPGVPGHGVLGPRVPGEATGVARSRQQPRLPGVTAPDLSPQFGLRLPSPPYRDITVDPLPAPPRAS